MRQYALHCTHRCSPLSRVALPRSLLACGCLPYPHPSAPYTMPANVPSAAHPKGTCKSNHKWNLVKPFYTGLETCFPHCTVRCWVNNTSQIQMLCHHFEKGGAMLQFAICIQEARLLLLWTTRHPLAVCSDERPRCPGEEPNRTSDQSYTAGPGRPLHGTHHRY